MSIPLSDGHPVIDSILDCALAGKRPEIALVLGSGLAPLVERVAAQQSLSYAQVPGLAAPTVAMHRGRLTFGDWAGKRMMVFEGRLHYYEGHAWDQVTAGIRIASQLGARQLLLTNSAGGIHEALAPGSFMAIRDHIEWNRPYCWREPGPGALGPARPSPYSPRLLAALRQAAAQRQFPLLEGIYACVTGPSYETKAEIRALKAWGADAVGMSTTREALCGAALGMEVTAVSCITNHAAGLGSGPLTHEEVVTTAAAQGERLADLVEAFLRVL